MPPFRFRERGLAVAVLFAMSTAYYAAPAKADLRQAAQAFENGDYERAKAEWHRLAERGEAEAEFGLGEIYEQANGDYKKAEVWYGKAAEHGSAKAEYRLALISMAGNEHSPPDIIKAYKWASLAAEGDGVWSELGKDLRGELESHSSAGEQVEGKRQAELWKAQHNPKPVVTPAPAAPAATAAIAPPIQPFGSPVTPHNQGGCTPPGWPGPPLPCSDRLPTIPGQAPPPVSLPAVPPAQVATLAVPPPLASSPHPLDELTAALKRVDCASLRGTISSQGAATISGTVPNPEERSKLVQVATRLSAASRPDVNVEIVPEPLCRGLVEFDSMRLVGLASDGIGLRLLSAGGRLREGEPIKVEVYAPAYPVNLRIDYFSLDGQVLHMWPNFDEPIAQLGARQTRVFGGKGKTWNAGGAPFGIEFIAVTATSQPLDLGPSRLEVESASSYLHELEAALRQQKPAAASSALVATVLVHTSP
jgi:tetratricopeptide (TPR) repeat protein